MVLQDVSPPPPLRGPPAEALRDRGYVVLDDVLSDDELGVLRHLCDGWADDDARDQQGGNLQYARFEDRHRPLLDVARSPSLLAAVAVVIDTLPSVNVTALAFRRPPLGAGAQALHSDLSYPDPKAPAWAATALVLLDAYRADNGATRLVPGSHRFGAVPKRYGQPASRHPDEVRVAASAGSAIVLDARLWHSGTRRDGGGERRVVQVGYRASR